MDFCPKRLLHLPAFTRERQPACICETRVFRWRRSFPDPPAASGARPLPRTGERAVLVYHVCRLSLRESDSTDHSPTVSSANSNSGRVLSKPTVSAAVVASGDPPTGRHERFQEPHGDSSEDETSAASTARVRLASERDACRRCASVRPQASDNL